MVAKHQMIKREAKRTQSETKRVQAAQTGVPKSMHEIDRLIHERLRLGIISALAVNDSLTFNELKQMVRTTDGNLSVHARKLEDAGYVSCAKTFEGRTPKTEFSLTSAGRKALERYLGHMEAVIGHMRRGSD